MTSILSVMRNMRGLPAALAVAAVTAVLGLTSVSLAEGLPWNGHAAPYDFTFGNHIDTHQQTMPMDDGTLSGFLYILFTGEVTPEGVRVARHVEAGDPAGELSVGWRIRGLPAYATPVHHQMGDHPLWLLDGRDVIPQPGGFTHFHWLDGPERANGLVVGQVYDGYLLELMARDTFAFRIGGALVTVRPGLDLATHTNIVTSFPGFTDGPGDGGHD